ncbi:MAG: sulfotransferase [Phycisphaerae bacterium]|nr:sulfotransferase [Phycisphaerae bacterium]
MPPFKLIMISAMYENGGNTTHRMLDGHPEIFAYPYESQLGTRALNDWLLSTVPFKYRWPEFAMSGNPADDYEAFFDEEMKTRLRVPQRSKFKDADMDLDEADRKRLFVQFLADKPRTRANIVEAFFRSTFDAWKNFRRTGRETTYLGYSPVIVLDTERILADFPAGHVLHVVRNPWAGYADTRKRPFPLSLSRYTWTWNLCQHMALTFAERYPKNFHILRFEDMIANPTKVMTDLCAKLGLSASDAVFYPSWNGTKLEQVYPWGTIRTPTPAVNLATANELSAAEQAEIRSLASVMLKLMRYDDFL